MESPRCKELRSVDETPKPMLFPRIRIESVDFPWSLGLQTEGFSPRIPGAVWRYSCGTQRTSTAGVAHTARLHARLLSCRDAPIRAVLSAAPQNHTDKSHRTHRPAETGSPRGCSFCRTAADNGPATAEGAAPLCAGERPRTSQDSQGSREQCASAPNVLPATRYSQHAPCQLLCR